MVRFVLATVLAIVASADETCEQSEPVSMLQTKDRGSLMQSVTLASQDFDQSDTQVQNFIDKVKDAAKTMNALDNKEALLQRASQGEKMEALIGDFVALPVEQQQKLEAVGNKIFEKLPASHKTALVQQVSHALDSSVSAKPQTRTEQTANGKKTTTYDERTGYFHSHEHGDRGTESVSRAKRGGHFHRHTYTHNGQGGNARTSSQSVGGGHEHVHVTSHTLNNGVTSTATNSASSGGGHTHSHGHTHQHAPDQQTVTGTSTATRDRSGSTSGHSHVHIHNERNGDSFTNSRATENGRETWEHTHRHDVSTGTHDDD